jgi:hypothetical protein
MSITIANTTFNNVKHDAAGDVLYLNVSDPADAVTFDDTPEGHNVGWNATGEIVASRAAAPTLAARARGQGRNHAAEPCRSQRRHARRSTASGIAVPASGYLAANASVRTGSYTYGTQHVATSIRLSARLS